MSTANLLYTDTEDALRDSVRRLFADRCKFEAVVALYDTDPDFTGLWKTLAAELGVAGLLVPESLGGAGASSREARPSTRGCSSCSAALIPRPAP